jgi:nitroreductase
MDFEYVIKKRRSIRKFGNEKVPNEILKKILYHGSIAPSGKNRQPWRFVVVQKNEEIKIKIAETMVCKANQMIDQNESAGVKNTARIIKEAPVFVAVFNIWGNEKQNSNLQSIGACIENICLSCTQFGLGSLWICDIDCCFSELQELLGKPNMSLVAGIALGYALENPKARPRLEVEEITYWM